MMVMALGEKPSLVSQNDITWVFKIPYIFRTTSPFSRAQITFENVLVIGIYFVIGNNDLTQEPTLDVQNFKSCYVRFGSVLHYTEDTPSYRNYVLNLLLN